MFLWRKSAGAKENVHILVDKWPDIDLPHSRVIRKAPDSRFRRFLELLLARSGCKHVDLIRFFHGLYWF